MNPTSSPEGPQTPDVQTPGASNPSAPSRGPRRGAAAAIAAGLVGGVAIGLFVAVPTLTSAAAPATTVTTAAPAPADPGDQTPGRAPDETDTDRAADHTARIRESLQALVDDGTINGAQADAVAAHLAQQTPGRPGADRGGRHDGGKGPLMGADADAFAQILGLADGAALRTELQSGKTIAEIATANGVEIQTVKDYLSAELKARLDEAVAAGRLTQAEADQKLANADAMIDKMINSNRRPGGRHGDGGAGDDAPTDPGSSEGPNIIQSAA